MKQKSSDPLAVAGLGLWEAYKAIKDELPEVNNPATDPQVLGFKPIDGFELHEVLVICSCGQRYITRGMGLSNNPLPPPCNLALVDCPECGKSADLAPTYAGHSGGVFNLAVHYYNLSPHDHDGLIVITESEASHD